MMSTDDVQSVFDDRYPALLGYARGILGATSDNAQALVRSCMLVRGAVVLPIGVTESADVHDGVDVYHVLRRRVLRRALRSHRQWWPALSRKARVESAPVDESYREPLRAAGTRECRAILLLHLVDGLSIQDAEDLVAALVPRSRDVRAAALEAQEIVADGPPELSTRGCVATRLAAPTVRSARVPWLLAALVTVVVATTAVVVQPDEPAPAPAAADLGVRVIAAVPKERFVSEEIEADACDLGWPPRGGVLAGGDRDLANVPLIRRAVHAWADQTARGLIGPTGAIHQRERADLPTPDVAVVFAGQTRRGERAVLLCQEWRIARYVESADRDPELRITTLPSMSSVGSTNRRIPFVDLGAAWLIDPDTTQVRSTSAVVADAEWTEHRLLKAGLVEDIADEKAEPGGCDRAGDTAPRLVQVYVNVNPRFLEPLDTGTVRWLTAVHGGEELPRTRSLGDMSRTLMPGMVWDVDSSPEEFRAIRALTCADVFHYDPGDPTGYSEVESLRMLAPLTVPGSGHQLTFRATLRTHSAGDDVTEEDFGAVTSETGPGFDKLRPLSPGLVNTADAVAGWTVGEDDRWYYVAAGNSRTARIEITGKLTGATTGRALVVAGPQAADNRLRLPKVPVAVAFYDKRGEVIDASN